jgi:hypothetical protein
MNPRPDRPYARRGRTPSFYERALAASDRELLDEAREVDGLDDEIAVLRVQIHRLLEDHQAEPQQVQAGIRLLVQALAARHRLTGREAHNLTEAATSLFEEFVAAFSTPDGEAGR